MKRAGENRKESFRHATIFSSVAGIACLLICGLLPTPGEARQSLSLDKIGFSVTCPGPARFTARPQDFNLAQSKSPRRPANLAAAASNSWPGLIRIEVRFARTSYSRSAYSAAQISQPSD